MTNRRLALAVAATVLDVDDPAEWAVEYIAIALAQARAEARAPFEGIADEMREFADRQWDSTEQAINYFEGRIRETAREPEGSRH